MACVRKPGKSGGWDSFSSAVFLYRHTRQYLHAQGTGKMKALLMREFGDTDVIKHPKYKTQPGHVLIKVLASGVNRLFH